MLPQAQLPRMYPPARRQCMARYCIFPSIYADMYADMSWQGTAPFHPYMQTCMQTCHGKALHLSIHICRHVCRRMDACICRQYMSERIAAAHVRAHCQIHVSGRPANMCQRCFLLFFSKPFCFFCFSGTMVWTRQAGTKATCVRARSLCVADARTRTGGGRGQGRGRAGNAGSVGSL